MDLLSYWMIDYILNDIISLNCLDKYLTNLALRNFCHLSAFIFVHPYATLPIILTSHRFFSLFKSVRKKGVIKEFSHSFCNEALRALVAMSTRPVQRKQEAGLRSFPSRSRSLCEILFVFVCLLGIAGKKIETVDVNWFQKFCQEKKSYLSIFFFCWKLVILIFLSPQKPSFFFNQSASSVGTSAKLVKC